MTGRFDQIESNKPGLPTATLASLALPEHNALDLARGVLLVVKSPRMRTPGSIEAGLNSAPPQVLAGMESGITQVASVPGGSDSAIVWNFPIDLTFKSTNVYGWPQLVIGVHGSDFLNRHVVKWAPNPMHSPCPSPDAASFPPSPPNLHPSDSRMICSSRGYGSVHMPTVPGSHDFHVHIFRPLSSSPMQQFIGWINGSPAEFIDPKRPALPTGR